MRTPRPAAGAAHAAEHFGYPDVYTFSTSF
jgi:hypothetical protein